MERRCVCLWRKEHFHPRSSVNVKKVAPVPCTTSPASIRVEITIGSCEVEVGLTAHRVNPGRQARAVHPNSAASSLAKVWLRRKHHRRLAKIVTVVAEDKTRRIVGGSIHHGEGDIDIRCCALSAR